MEIKAKIGLNPCGAYDGTREYSFLDTTEAISGTYMSLKDNNKGHEVTDTSWWECIIDLTGVNKAKDDANTAASNADNKAALANTAIENANTATDSANTAASNADSATAKANTATANCETAASEATTATTNANSAAKSATDAAASATAASIPSDYTSGISEGIAHDEGDADSNRDNYNSDEIGDAHATTLTIDEPYKVCGQSSILTGTSAPTSIIPDFTGQIYIDIANGNAYIAVYNSTSTNWVKIN